MSVIKSISTSEELSGLAREYHMSWSEAARIGMAIMLGDIGVREYDNSLNLFRKMRSFRELAEKNSQRVAELEAEADVRGVVYAD